MISSTLMRSGHPQKGDFSGREIPWCSILPVGKNDDDILFCEKMIPLPETHIFAPKNGWLEYFLFFWGPGLFSGASC